MAPRPSPLHVPTLHSEVRSGPPPRTVLLHGFTQTGACWAETVRTLPGEVVTVDLPGHGGSADVHADLTTSAALAAAAGGRGTWIGYSMGARAALHVALDHPAVVDRLVLVSGTAGIDDADERKARRAADEALATRLRAIGVERFLDEWLALPLFAGVPAHRDCRDARMGNTAEGLARSLELSGTGTQAPLWSRLPELAGLPVLVVTGGLDARFTALGARLVAGIGPSATHVVLDGCGHTPPLEDPDAFGAAVLAWRGRAGA